MKSQLWIALVAAGLMVAPSAQAQDIQAGEEIYQAQCRVCHGRTAKGLSSYPKLAGREADYLAERLQQYRDGERLGPNTMLMAPQAQGLSDDDITNIASYVAETFK
ncbi:MAG: c-type cytochrome [Pseudomonadota bacterium]